MKIRSLILAAALCFCGVTAASAQVYDHNGSTVVATWGEGDDLTVTYVRPRPGLPVTSGTVLFEGASPANGSIYGTAYVFSSACGSASYRVQGRFTGNNFTLRGEAPVRDENCRIVRYDENANSTLVFTYLRDDTEEH